MSESEPVATEVTWNQAAWVTTLGIAFIITAVAIAILAVVILASLRYFPHMHTSLASPFVDAWRHSSFRLTKG